MSVHVNKKIIETDEEGYLLNRNDWSDEVAEEMSAQQAEKDHVKLTEAHWGLIHYFRGYYEINKVHPTMHKLVTTLGRQHGEHFHDEKEYEKYLYKIFPHGPVQELCKLAGLPKPLDDVDG